MHDSYGAVGPRASDGAHRSSVSHSGAAEGLRRMARQVTPIVLELRYSLVIVSAASPPNLSV
ncbi:hypothetical protein VTG60DRAFT_1 [Thermothelomyces hinnuleus]